MRTLACLMACLLAAAFPGCTGLPFLEDTDGAWALDDPRGDAPAAADILQLRIEPGQRALVELELAEAFEDPQGQVQVVLQTANGMYMLTLTLDESYAYHVAPCEGCSAPETGTQVGEGTLDGTLASWRFTQEHRLTGLVFGQTLGADCRYDLVASDKAPEMPTC